MSGVRKQNLGQGSGTLANPFVEAGNRMDTKKEHRCFSNRLLVQKPTSTQCFALQVRNCQLPLAKCSNHLASQIERCKDPSDQIRRVPSSTRIGNNHLNYVHPETSP